jgi:DNA helicase-2/ATP-dependent DNA helicase PcrA
VLTYARCPRDFYWSVVRPLPSPPKPAARLGSIVHRLLERRVRNLPDLLDPDDLGGDQPSGVAEPELVERATRNFAASRYARLPAPDAEVGVVLRVGSWVVRGRIDAVFRPGEGPAGADPAAPGVELVDWKTGGRVEPIPGGLDQLGVYALALRQLGQLPRDGCLASYCYLGGDHPEIDSRRLGPAELDREHARLQATLAALDRGDYARACGRRDCDTCRRTFRAEPTAPLLGDQTGLEVGEAVVGLEPVDGAHEPLDRGLAGDGGPLGEGPAGLGFEVGGDGGPLPAVAVGHVGSGVEKPG